MVEQRPERSQDTSHGTASGTCIWTESNCSQVIIGESGWKSDQVLSALLEIFLEVCDYFTLGSF